MASPETKPVTPREAVDRLSRYLDEVESWRSAILAGQDAHEQEIELYKKQIASMRRRAEIQADPVLLAYARAESEALIAEARVEAVREMEEMEAKAEGLPVDSEARREVETLASQARALHNGTVFLDDQHRYWLKGVRIPGVTEALRAVGIIQHWGSDTAARDLGTRVHKACELYDLGQDPYRFEQDRGLEPYVQAWSRFRMQYEADNVEIPETPYSDGLSACTPDRVMAMRMYPDQAVVGLTPLASPRCRAIVEIKTGQEADWWPIQLAAQLNTYTNSKPNINPKPYIRAAVQLRAETTGTVRFRVYAYGDSTSKRDRDLWLAARAIAQHRINTGSL